MFDFLGQTALVTGGTRGIGRAIAAALDAHGAQVVVTGTSPGRPDALPSSWRYIGADFASPAWEGPFTHALEELESIDVCVNNAGINAVADIRDQSPEAIDRVLRVNLTAPAIVTSRVARRMAAAGYGRIVNVSSIYGVISRAGRAPYSASKSGLIGLTRATALDLAADGVLVNAVCPGFVDTELTRRVLGDDGIREVIGTVPVGRLAHVDDIVPPILFLASKANTYMTGQSVVVDGGHVIR